MRKLAACVRVVVCALALGAAGAAAGTAKASPQEFQAWLAPHGRWLASSRYGRVWQPTVAKPGWNPYYDGHWEYTDVGQTWVSDYPWGSVAYHYGTWAIEPGSGWVWIPGDTWAPSWVVFRTGPDVIGWAPVAPGFLVGGAIVSGPELEASFVFVPSRQFFAPRVRACALPASRTTVIVTKTKIVQKSLRIENHVVVNRGPSLEELRHATGHPVRVVPLETVKGMGPGVRREIQVDSSRARNGVRVSGPGTTAAAMRAPAPGAAPVTSKASASTAYDTPGDAPRGGDARGRDDRAGDDRGSAAGRSVRDPYDELDAPRTTRVAHQDVYVRDEHPSGRPTGDMGDAPASAGSPSSANGETQSDRDAKLLVSREKSVRKSAHPAGKPLPATGKSSRSKGRR